MTCEMIFSDNFMSLNFERENDHTSMKKFHFLNDIRLFMDRFEVKRIVGVGSFGRAILCNDKKTHMDVIVKEINITAQPPDIRQASLNEAKILQKIKHPSIVGFVDSFTEEGKLYIVMEYAEGGDLQGYLRKQNGKHLPEKQIISWIFELCSALNYVHSLNILHRDIKSQNVFLDAAHHIKLGDFGIAKILENTNDFARTMVGSPFYLSPEICNGEPYNAKTDVWSLGCVFYEMCTFSPAFGGNNMGNVVIKIMMQKQQPIPKMYSKQLSNLIDSMLQKNPDDRPTLSQILTLNMFKPKSNDVIPKVKVAQPSHVLGLNFAQETQTKTKTQTKHKPTETSKSTPKAGFTKSTNTLLPNKKDSSKNNSIQNDASKKESNKNETQTGKKTMNKTANKIYPKNETKTANKSDSTKLNTKNETKPNTPSNLRKSENKTDFKNIKAENKTVNKANPKIENKNDTKNVNKSIPTNEIKSSVKNDVRIDNKNDAKHEQKNAVKFDSKNSPTMDKNSPRNEKNSNLRIENKNEMKNVTKSVGRFDHRSNVKFVDQSDIRIDTHMNTNTNTNDSNNTRAPLTANSNVRKSQIIPPRRGSPPHSARANISLASKTIGKSQISNCLMIKPLSQPSKQSTCNITHEDDELMKVVKIDKSPQKGQFRKSMDPSVVSSTRGAKPMRGNNEKKRQTAKEIRDFLEKTVGKGKMIKAYNDLKEEIIDERDVLDYIGGPGNEYLIILFRKLMICEDESEFICAKIL
ncbi:hypothetical protein TRFO_12585 [Tritrichomonas foetus]|uniref:non-specific serine/threonine protein kinase n=1 Tax=Tritrichomonas foetus TaxID=1144522 RepID=A0A1J4L2C7_9EUKA|nr:hypothetical protein TRFO_12585 [Tritrichomonas foetus]|eukprot:OHT17240.1 hypothetical protein TRFO_12585 [Tritrichomonas foetus]